MTLHRMNFGPFQRRSDAIQVDFTILVSGRKIRKRYRVPDLLTTPAILKAIDAGEQPHPRSDVFAWARERVAEAERAVLDREVKAPPEPAVAPEFRVFAERDFMATYLDSIAAKPATRKGYRSRLNRHLIPTLGHLRLDQIGAAEVAAIQAIKLKPSSVNQILAALLKMLTWAKELGHIETVPKVKKLKERSTKTDEEMWWQPEELDALLASAGSISVETLVFVLLTVDAGLRVGEICVLQWADIDLKKKTLTVRQTLSDGEIVEPKGGRARTVEVSTRLVDALRRHRHLQSPFVFCRLLGKGSRGGCSPANRNRKDLTPRRVEHWSTQYASDILHAACDRAHLPRVGPHKGRHTCGSRLAELGFSSFQIMKFLGQRTEDMARRYMRASRRKMREMADALGG